MVKLNDFFDIILCVNLDRSMDRWNIINKKFKERRIVVSRFEALDKLSPEIQHQFNEHQKMNQSSKMKRLGRFAIWKTYCKLFDYILTLNVKNVLIFEDDILFHKDFEILFDQSSRMIPETWDMWYLGRTQTKFDGISIKDGFYKSTNYTFGAFAIGLKTDFIKSWIDEYKLGLKNNDHFLASGIHKQNVYVSMVPIFGHSLGMSLNSDYVISDSIAMKLPWFRYDKNLYI
jgi:GR25 family glycosyltransferase involved in LPS biosynthesis